MPAFTRTAASLIGIVAVFALVLYLAYGSGSGGDSAATPTPSAAVAASTTARPQLTARPARPPLPTPAAEALPPVVVATGVRPLEVGNLVQFPDNAALIMETGCWQCDGPSTGLRRMYKGADGVLKVDQLLSLGKLGIVDPRAYFTGYALAPDASEMLAAVCLDGGCGHGLDGWSPEARTSVYESEDGGVTWALLEESDFALSVEGLVDPYFALVSWQEQPPPIPPVYATYPGFELASPPDANNQDYVPFLAISGEIFWSSYSEPTRLVRGDGYVAIDLRENTHIRPYQSWQPLRTGDALLGWSWSPDQRQTKEFISLVSDFGRTTSTYELHPSDAWMISSIWSAGDVYGTMATPPLIEAPTGFLGLLPAVLDLGRGTYNLIEEPFLRDGYDRQRDIVRAVQTDPFARVVGVEGSCLNVREAPSGDAYIRTCVSDGVLLSVGVLSDESGEWLSVTTPDGTTGYAATEFLEY